MTILLGLFLLIWALIGLFWICEYLVNLWKFDKEQSLKSGDLPITKW